MRVVAFCAGAALLVGLLFGVMPAWKATDVLVGGSDRLRQPHDDGRRRTTSRTARHRRGRDGGPAAVWRGAAAADAPRRRSVRSRVSRRQRAVDARRSAGLEVPDRRIAAAVLRSGRGRDRRCSGRRGRGVGERPAAGFLRRRRHSRSRSSATLRSTTASGRAPTYQVVSPTYFSTLDLPILAGRAFDRRDTRDGVPVCIVNEAFARDVSRAVADRPARGAAAGVVAGSRSRSCARSSVLRGR